MDSAAELVRNPISTRFSLSMEMSRLTRNGTAEPTSRDQILRRERERQGNINFPCSADHGNHLISTTLLAICVTIHTYILHYSKEITV